MSERTLKIRVSTRFLKACENPWIDGLAQDAVHDFERKYVSDPRTAIHGYDRVAGHNALLLEIDLSGAARLVAHWQAGVLTLLDAGGHETVPRASNLDFNRLLETSAEAPERFYIEEPERLLRRPDWRFAQFGNEIHPEWVYCLDAEQARVADALHYAALECLLGDSRPAVHFVVGGPGTGKTSILLLLMLRLRDDGEANIRLEIPPQVLEFVRRCLGSSVDEGVTRGEAKLLLIDDPASLDDIETAITYTPNRRLVIAAFDPLQLTSEVTDDDFGRLTRKRSATIHQLHTCYRQKENVGEATLQVMNAVADSSPYLASDKKAEHRAQRRELTEIANQLIFSNRFGYTDVCLAMDEDSVDREIDRILRQPGGLWNHVPAVLVAIIDPELKSLPPSFKRPLERIRGKYEVIHSSSIARIKGVEYQHVFVIAKQRLLKELDEGFTGSGRRTYEQRRLLRIPFSRAKDSLVTFAVE